MRLAREVAGWSKDPSTQVGAVAVSPDRTDIVLGYNGFPRKMVDSPQLYADRALKYPRMIHGEMNLILLARRSLEGYTLYTWPIISCDRCSVHVVQAGFTRCVGPKPGPGMERWHESLELSRANFAEARVEVLEFEPELLNGPA